jgi:hypothetical protein
LKIFALSHRLFRPSDFSQASFHAKTRESHGSDLFSWFYKSKKQNFLEPSFPTQSTCSMPHEHLDEKNKREFLFQNENKKKKNKTKQKQNKTNKQTQPTNSRLQSGHLICPKVILRRG